MCAAAKALSMGRFGKKMCSEVDDCVKSASLSVTISPATANGLQHQQQQQRHLGFTKYIIYDPIDGNYVFIHNACTFYMLFSLSLSSPK